MTEINQGPQIVNISISDIHILNPRVRNQKVFREITENIAQVGLKRPIASLITLLMPLASCPQTGTDIARASTYTILKKRINR